MWLNQQTLDAIRIMAEVAARWPDLVRASELVEMTGVSFVNIQKTVHALGRAGLLANSRGRNGGIRLARGPETISLGEIVRAFEAKDCPVSFLVASTVDAAISKVLFQAHRGFFQPLESMSLSGIVETVRSDSARPGDAARRLEA